MNWFTEISLALTLVFIFWIVGCSLGARLREKLFPNLELNSLIIDWAIGWGVIGYIIYAIGLLGWLYPAVLLALALGAIFLSFPYTGRIFNRLRQTLNFWRFEKDYLAWIFLGLIVIFALLHFIVALAPAIKFDDLWYHLTEARFYLIEHSIRPFLPPAQLGQSSVTPRLVEMFYTLVLAANPISSVASKLVHFSLGIGAVIGLIELNRRIFSVRTGLIAGLILITTPVVGWLSQTAYIDLGTLFYGVAAWIAYEHCRKNGRDLTLFALLFGFLLATKLWVLLFVPVIFIDLLVARVSLKEIIRTFVISFLIFAPWLIEAYIATGNPIYPVFAGPTDLEHLGGAKSISDWFGRVYWQTWYPTMERIFKNLIPWLSFVFLVILTPLRTNRQVWRWILFGSGLILAWSIIPVRDDRYLIVFTLPLLSVAAWRIDTLLKRDIVGLATGISLIVLVFFLAISPLKRAIYYWPVVTGQVSRHEFLTENVAKNIWGCYDRTGDIERALQKGKLLVFCHNMFYLDVSFEDGFDEIPRYKASSRDELLQKIKQNGFTHVLTKAPSYSLKNILETSHLEYPEGDLWLREHFKLIYTSEIDNNSLYEII